jgi:hypothetical protein
MRRGGRRERELRIVGDRKVAYRDGFMVKRKKFLYLDTPVGSQHIFAKIDVKEGIVVAGQNDKHANH